MVFLNIKCPYTPEKAPLLWGFFSCTLTQATIYCGQIP